MLPTIGGYGDEKHELKRKVGVMVKSVWESGLKGKAQLLGQLWKHENYHRKRLPSQGRLTGKVRATSLDRFCGLCAPSHACEGCAAPSGVRKAALGQIRIQGEVENACNASLWQLSRVNPCSAGSSGCRV